jgi:hypothetical protein
MLRIFEFYTYLVILFINMISGKFLKIVL